MKILLIDDPTRRNPALVKALEGQGYELDWADDEASGEKQATAGDYAVILIGKQTARLDGIRLCQHLRAAGYDRVLMLLTDEDGDTEAIAGFAAGADDCISDTSTPDNVLAQIRTLLRRKGLLKHPETAPSRASALRWGPLVLDGEAGRVTLGEQVIPLTATEFNLLELLLRHPERIFSRSAILDRLWDFDDAPSDRAIITHIKEVRKKLKAAGLTEEIIETIYGMGYRLKPPPQSTIHPQEAAPTTALNSVLARFRGTFLEQVAVLEQARTALLENTLEEALQQQARQEAHKLSGSLAPFGYPQGSTLARTIDHDLGEVPLSPEARNRLPALIEALRQELAVPPQAAPLVVVPAIQPCRVLVVDDDLALTEQLRAESAAWGCQMDIAPNPIAARSHLAQSTPDVVLLDLSFPDVEEDGVQLLQDMTARSPDLPVIVFTGRDTLADRLAVSQAGARQFLHKPATSAQILGAIARLVTRAPSVEARVLVVDDEPGMLATLSNLLTPWGLAVTTLADPHHFWETLVATAPDLVLLDLEMPEINGLELCQVIRQDAQWEPLPILVVTAHRDADTLQRAFAAGADDFITKPVLGPELVTRVLSRLERTHTRQKNLRVDGPSDRPLKHQHRVEPPSQHRLGKNADCQASLQQQTQQKQLLWNITQAIRQSLELETILHAAVTEVRQLLSLDRVAIYRFNPNWSGNFVVESVAAGWVRLADPQVRKVWEDTYLQETQGGRFQNQETLTVADIYTAGLQPCHVELLEQFQARAYAIAPIFVGNALWGLFGMYQNAAPYPWQAWEIELLQQTANQLAIAIQQANLYTQLQTELQERQETVAILDEAERRWRSLLENVQLLVVGLDPNGYINYVNPFFLTLTGYTQAEVMGQPWMQHFLPPAQRDTIQNIFTEVLAGNTHSYYQNSILTQAGEERFIAWNNTRLQDSSGQITGVISIGEDITERQKVETMKNEFIGIVSHELRTPLTAIQMSLGLLKTGIYANRPEKAQRMIEIALIDTNRLVNLVNDILDLERLESGRATLEKTHCEAAELMQQAVDGMQAIATQHQIRLTIAPTQATAWAAADAIIQTLTNLLSNAIKFSPPHSVVQLQAAAQGDHVLFQVADQGRGIPADMLETIFGRFQQVDASDSREKGGTGLGLTICRSIIERHGGRIWAESILGEGSTFYFTLPLGHPL